MNQNQKAQKEHAQAVATHHHQNASVDEMRASFRGGMGHLDAEQAKAYGEKMKGKQSEEETDRDIYGLRSKEPTFRTKSYAEVDKDYSSKYEKMEKSKNLINKIPS